MDKPTFETLGLSPEILKAVAVLGFEEASPIQAAAIPQLLKGNDVVGQSQTGSGKTAAFAIPALELVEAQNRAVQVLILCPTRELATQVADEVHKLGVFKKGLHVVPIYGGASYERQFYELKKGVQIVIGTPGRLIDHLDRGTLSLSEVRMVILDEADRMLDLGFRDDIEKILSAAPAERQTVFFSATVSKPIRELINTHASNPVTVKMEERELTVPTVEQVYYEVQGREKFNALLRLIDFHAYKLGIIFCNTQRMVDELADRLVAQGFSADRLHGGIAQAQRTRVMNKFKKAEFEFLVATDVAARGIDVDDLQIVVNFDLPYDAEDYVHRIGRTGRAGRQGVATTFVSGREIYKLQFIERFTKTRIRRGTLPTIGEVEERKAGLLLEKVRAVLQSGKFAPHTGLVDLLLEEGFLPTDIAASLFQLLAGGEADSQSFPAPEDKKERRNREDFFEREERSGRRGSEGREHRRSEEKRCAGSNAIWVRVDKGKAHGVRPRDVINILETGLDVSTGSVGDITLDSHQSFAEVSGISGPILDGSPVKIETEDGPIHLSLMADAPPPRRFKKKPTQYSRKRERRRG